MVNFGPLAAEIGPVVLGTPANFNGFLVLASLLQRRRSTKANQTLHDVWLLPTLVDYIYIFGGCCPVTEFDRCKIHFASSKSKQERQHWTECTEYVWRSGKLVSGQRNGRFPHSSRYPRKATLNSVKTTEQLLWFPMQARCFFGSHWKGSERRPNRNCRRAGRIPTR